MPVPAAQGPTKGTFIWLAIVAGDELQGTAENAAAAVDLVDRQPDPARDRLARLRRLAAERGDEPDPDRFSRLDRREARKTRQKGAEHESPREGAGGIEAVKHGDPFPYVVDRHPQRPCQPMGL